MQDDGRTFYGLPYSFILSVLAMGLTFWGTWVGFLPAEIFTTVIIAVLSSYAGTSVASKWRDATIAKKATAPSETTTTTTTSAPAPAPTSSTVTTVTSQPTP